MPTGSNSKGWGEVLKEFVYSKMLDFHTSFPAKIVAIHDNNSVDVKPLIKTKMVDGTQREYEVIYNVRDAINSGSFGDAYITFPLEVGDTVWVMISERDTYNLMKSNGSEPKDSTTLETHDLSDAFCFPCFFTDTKKIPRDNKNINIKNGSTTLVIGKDSITATTTTYNVNAETTNISGDVNIGGNVNIKGTSTAADHISDKISGKGHTHDGVTTGGGVSGTPTVT